MRKIFYLLLALTVSPLAQALECDEALAPRSRILRDSGLPFNALDFRKIRFKDFRPAWDEALRGAKAQIEAIASNSEPPTFENTLAAMEFASDDLWKAYLTVNQYGSTRSTPELRKLLQELSAESAAYENYVSFHPQLFKRVKAVYDRRRTLRLNPEEKMLLEKTYRSFLRGGALLPPSKKKQLAKIDSELAELGERFEDNVMRDFDNYELLIEDKSELTGLPASAVKKARKLAQKAGKKGYLLTRKVSDLVAVLDYAENRALREKLYRAYGGMNTQGKTDNQDIVLRIARLRQKRAEMLGYKNYAAFVLEESMAKTPARVKKFLDEIVRRSLPAAKTELAELEAFAGHPLERWDVRFYREKLRKQKFDFDREELRPYFLADNVFKGAFAVSSRLFNVAFIERPDLPVYHPSVKVYEVRRRDGETVALLYVDIFERKGKRGGAWAGSLRPLRYRNGKVEIPIITLGANFSAEQPSLLTYDDVRTFFHEIGHELHRVLSTARFKSLAGTNVYTDWVELPSQLMENWVDEPEVLKLFARHYRTDEVIPQTLIDKLRASRNLHAAYRQVVGAGDSYIDQAWHTQDVSRVKDVGAFENRAAAGTRLLPAVEGVLESPSLTHIFSGGYAASLYSYKWCDMLEADVFEAFLDKGLFDPDLARSLEENVLGPGGTIDPDILFTRFRGRAPSLQPLLRRQGLLPKDGD